MQIATLWVAFVVGITEYVKHKLPERYHDFWLPKIAGLATFLTGGAYYFFDIEGIILDNKWVMFAIVAFVIPYNYKAFKDIAGINNNITQSYER